MNARLTIISGDKAGDAFTLAAKARLVIGRSSQADVSLDSTDVSRLHCQVEGDGDLFWLTDLKSSNGTFVNDQPVTNYLLYDGDVISVGGVKLEFAVVQESGDGAETDRAVPAAPTPAPSAEADLPTLAVGQRVGGCEIQEKLARGAPFGVYKALHLSSHRTLTLKTLPRRLAASRALVQRLADDVQAARPLSHQNLVPTHLAGQDEGICFFGMEYVVGRGLQSVLLSEKKRTKLTVSRAMKIARHVGRALAHAHKNGVVHRAVAPRSIVISMEGLAHLGDFGLASALHSGSAGEIREMAAWLRTLPYVAPEVLRASSTVDQRADLYGLGATLYHMLAGTAPWAGRRVSDAAPPKGAKSVRASRDELAPPSKLNPSVTEPLSALVMKCLERDASRRFQSAREFLAALKAVAGSSG